MKPTIIIVGADKGGVGKTTITRVLLDYLKDKGVRPRVFDTEGTLHKFYDYARVVDIDKVAGQMQIFDGVLASEIIVVDMKAGSLSQTLRTMRNAGLLDKVDKGKIRLIIMHVLGSDTQSMGEIVDTNALLDEGAEHVLIENHASDGHFFRWDDATRALLFQAVKPEASLEIPHLDPMAVEDIDRRKQHFSDYIKNVDGKNSNWLTRLVRFWRGQVYAEFDKLKLVP